VCRRAELCRTYCVRLFRLRFERHGSVRSVLSRSFVILIDKALTYGVWTVVSRGMKRNEQMWETKKEKGCYEISEWQSR
jgi:hypothetical protein